MIDMYFKFPEGRKKETGKSLDVVLLSPEKAYKKLGIVVNTVSPQAEGHNVLGFFDPLEPNAIYVSSELALESITSDWLETAVHELGHQKRVYRNPYSSGDAHDEEIENRRWLSYSARFMSYF